jgi:tRNA (mo5U34)-methyltransferase
MLSREGILEGIAQLEPWWHCIDLGQGIKTKTVSLMGEPLDHPLDRWELISKLLRTDLSGKSVIDIGCNAGFFSIEARRRNAAYVLGIDTKRHELMQANFVKRILNLDIDYRQMSIYDLDQGSIGQFDVVLALGIIYHCKHLLIALEKLFSVTKELLIVDSSVLSGKNITKNLDYQSGSHHEIVNLLGYVDQSTGSVDENHKNWFFPTGDCLRSMLVDIGFNNVDLVLNEGQRAVLVCHKSRESLDSREINGLRAKISMTDFETTCSSNEDLQFTVYVQNMGSTKWIAFNGQNDKRGTVRLGARLFSETAQIDWEYGGTGLNCDLKPGENISLKINLRAPSSPGVYYVEFDMVSEYVTWFQDVGSTSFIHELRVR